DCELVKVIIFWRRFVSGVEGSAGFPILLQKVLVLDFVHLMPEAIKVLA
ncbi:18215_t:CDS:1, partial [Acaulospora morrowiae]